MCYSLIMEIIICLCVGLVFGLVLSVSGRSLFGLLADTVIAVLGAVLAWFGYHGHFIRLPEVRVASMVGVCAIGSAILLLLSYAISKIINRYNR